MTIANNKLSRIGIEWLLNFLIHINLISNQNHTLHCTINLGRKLWKKKRLFLFGPKIIFYDIMEVSAILFVGFAKEFLQIAIKGVP